MNANKEKISEIENINANIPDSGTSVSNDATKPALLTRFKNFFGVKRDKKYKNNIAELEREKNKIVELEKENARKNMENTLTKIDTQLDMLAGHNNTLIEEVRILRETNNHLIRQIEKIRRREFISKIIAIISGIITGVLVILKILQWTV